MSPGSEMSALDLKFKHIWIREATHQVGKITSFPPQIVKKDCENRKPIKSSKTKDEKSFCT